MVHGVIPGPGADSAFTGVQFSRSTGNGRGTKMIKVLVGTSALMLLVVISAGPVVATGSTETATGDVEYYQAGYYFDFNAHASRDGCPAKGEAWNYTSYGGWYRADVRCVNVIDDKTVLFAAKLTDTNMASWGPWVLIQVFDGGEPGVGTDLIWGQFLTQADAISKCQGGISPNGGPWEVLSGNLQVHSK
jgi:hypothetical protein